MHRLLADLAQDLADVRFYKLATCIDCSGMRAFPSPTRCFFAKSMALGEKAAECWS